MWTTIRGAVHLNNSDRVLVVRRAGGHSDDVQSGGEQTLIAHQHRATTNERRKNKTCSAWHSSLSARTPAPDAFALSVEASVVNVVVTRHEPLRRKTLPRAALHSLYSPTLLPHQHGSHAATEYIHSPKHGTQPEIHRRTQLAAARSTTHHTGFRARTHRQKACPSSEIPYSEVRKAVEP